MKLIFTHADHPDLDKLTKDEIYTTSLEIPNEALHLIGCRERVLRVGELVAPLTQGSLYLSCKELDLKNYPLKLADVADEWLGVRHNINAFIIYFEQPGSHKRQLKIWSPFAPISDFLIRQRFARTKREKNTLTRWLTPLGQQWCKTDEERAFAEGLELAAQQILVLLNAEPAQQSWECRGFHPWWVDDVLIKLHNERNKRALTEFKKAERLAARQKAREAKLLESGKSLPEVPQTGAGRRPGARPGKFKGVQMRSQLEIRFAAELEERGIRWVYEGAVLGEGGYLVDFYLPDYGMWVEVKGRFEPRDKILLKEVSVDLKRDRKERLFVYGQSRAWIVNSRGFREIKHDQFWNFLPANP